MSEAEANTLQKHRLIYVEFAGDYNWYTCECGYVGIELSDEHFTDIHPDYSSGEKPYRHRAATRKEQE